jgi:hypothetical protein
MGSVEGFYNVNTGPGGCTSADETWTLAENTPSTTMNCASSAKTTTAGSDLGFASPAQIDNNLAAPINCDFEFNYGVARAPDVASRSAEVQQEWLRSRLNVAQKLQVVLTKVKT